MAYSNIDSLNLGSILQIAFTNGIRNQISTDFRDFEYINRARVGNSLARELRFMLQSTLGAARTQYRNPGTSGRSFPTAQQVSLTEYTAKFKELNTTIELEQNLWYRAMKTPEKYADVLATEVDASNSVNKRRLAADLYGDGTGVVGTVASAAVESPASNKLVFTLSTSNTTRGHAGMFEFGDILVLKAAAGSASALDTNLATEPAYWKVIDKNRDAATVTLQGLDSNLAAVATISSISVQPTAGDVFYRYGQPTIPDLTSISDYATVTEVIPGLESLTAADSRVVHGITMSGATAGSRYDAGADPIDVRHIERMMNVVKLAVGQDRYRWKMLTMAPETQSALIEGRETDRRFQSVEDNKRGVRFLAYIHRNDTLECNDSEYCPPKRAYVIPEAKNGDKALEFHSTDFDTVKGGDMSDWHLKPASGGGHVNTMVSYLQAVCTLISRHPAAIGVIHNFTNA